MRGKIYILTNDAMPDYIKIGFAALDEILSERRRRLTEEQRD